jgi:hypothetical protein
MTIDPRLGSDCDLRGAHGLPLDAVVGLVVLPELPSEETRKALTELLVRVRLKAK